MFWLSRYSDKFTVLSQKAYINKYFFSKEAVTPGPDLTKKENFLKYLDQIFCGNIVSSLICEDKR